MSKDWDWEESGERGNPPEQTEEQRKIVRKAQKRFDGAMQWESVARSRFLDDIRFACADAYNGWQWPDTLRKNRDVDGRPNLTINKARQHNLQIINDAKKNKPGIQIHAVGGGAGYEDAQCIEGICRRIEYQSNASVAYDTAVEFQVKAGLGVIRVVTDYAGDDTTDQEIFIRRVTDPLSVFFDPDAKEADKSDGRFAFVFDDVPRDVFNRRYPEYVGFGGQTALGNSSSGWVQKDHIRVCEYFYLAEKEPDELVSFPTPHGVVHIKKSELNKELYKKVIDDPTTRTRALIETEVRYCFIIGEMVAEESVWPGRYIPLIPVIGEEEVVDGVMDRKGHTRCLIDPQRMTNYWASCAVEFGALQNKIPYIAPEQAIEGHESYWNTANTANYSVLPYNHVSDDGSVIPPPIRAPLPEQAPLYIQGLKLAGEDMMMVSGQYQAQMGAPSNERSGKAITERQRQGDTATYHYIDNLGVAIRHLGKIMIDLIPKVYDTRRIVMAMGDNGKSFEVEINPDAALAYQQLVKMDGEVAKRVLNPMVGKYDVRADIGPAYATKREEAFNAFTQIITQAPALTGIIGDILLRAGDFPMAEEAAERLERMVPPQALGKGPSKDAQELAQQLQQMKVAYTEVTQKLMNAENKLHAKDQMRDIDAYEAETKRIGTIGKIAPVNDPKGVELIVRQVMMDMMRGSLNPIFAENQPQATGDTGPAQSAGPQGQGAPPPTSGGGMMPPGGASMPPGGASMPPGGAQMPPGMPAQSGGPV